MTVWRTLVIRWSGRPRLVVVGQSPSFEVLVVGGGLAGSSRRARALEIFDRVPELETWTYGPEAHCDDAVRAELLA